MNHRKRLPKDYYEPIAGGQLTPSDASALRAGGQLRTLTYASVLYARGGASAPKETSRRMKEYLKEKGFEEQSYNIFAFTGNEDIAFPALSPQIQAMLSDGFHNGRDKILRFESWPEGVHTYEYMYEYIGYLSTYG